MLRRQNRTLKDVPREVRLSLEILDNILDEFDQENDVSTAKNMADVPRDVRHSLEILDNILDEYDIQDNEAASRKYTPSETDLRKIEDIPPEVCKSLNMLDSVLDEVKNEAVQKRTVKRTQRSDGSLIRKERHEDIRRSLEVLDSVLAEFDDCLDSWDSSLILQNGKCLENDVSETRSRWEQGESNNEFTDYSYTSDDKFSNKNQSTDGSTSHNNRTHFQEQAKINSPPPIPKRSPGTKLSERDSDVFNFSTDNASLDSFDSAPQSNQGRLSQHHHAKRPINDLSAEENGDIENGDVFHHRNGVCESGKCANCGCELEETIDKLIMNSEEGKSFSSPFQQRKQMFEDKIAEASASALNAELNIRQKGSSFKSKKKDQMQVSEIDIADLSPESGFEGSSHSSLQPSDDLSADSSLDVKIPQPTSSEILSSQYHAANCTCKERIRKLDQRFAETRRRLKLNKIKGLEKKPPSFVPPSPPGTAKGNKTETFSLQRMNKFMETSRISENATAETSCSYVTSSSKYDTSPDGIDDTDSFHTATTSFIDDPIEDEHKLTCQKITNSLNSKNFSPQMKFCSRCSRTIPAPLVQTIEDLPNLLPTDALNRPQLGLSYSMEDDLSPGVKEIRQTSTPKSDISPSSSGNAKEVSSLSTFSLSASSLGYVSSQSDLELNSSLTEPDKVPVSTLRSKTLPIGVNLTPSPFYSAVDNNHENDYNDNRLFKDQKFSDSYSEDIQLRSSSAPPLPELEKQKKKHFRGFSRKEKKDKKKNEDNVSVKSDFSLDEGIILKKIEALDGGTDVYDAGDKNEAVVEKKRRSIWHSIMGKK
ncbi:uncharacterized protein LOC118188521 isoform X3 [Stegodyphus dumicola]|uniref:uncharacterized protein LOC118188521 isoform X3 n=1 Tax=Stegodyphus dumicola TaxID=202533 RepID=UPI0015B1DBB3|nr:uncharacterized protein LOC118188521 isoform X3 [Stegodyphus dumicola]